MPVARRRLSPAAERRVFDRYGGQCAGWLHDGRERRRCEHVFASVDAVFCFDHGVQRAMAVDEEHARRLEMDENFRPLCQPCTRRKDADDAGARRKVRQAVGANKPKFKRPIPPGPKLQGRGFTKSLRKRFNGKVEAAHG